MGGVARGGGAVLRPTQAPRRLPQATKSSDVNPEVRAYQRFTRSWVWTALAQV